LQTNQRYQPYTPRSPLALSDHSDASGSATTAKKNNRYQLAPIPLKFEDITCGIEKSDFDLLSNSLFPNQRAVARKDILEAKSAILQHEQILAWWIKAQKNTKRGNRAKEVEDALDRWREYGFDLQMAKREEIRKKKALEASRAALREQRKATKKRLERDAAAAAAKQEQELAAMTPEQRADALRLTREEAELEQEIFSETNPMDTN
jgi:hypothetical protein